MEDLVAHNIALFEFIFFFPFPPPNTVSSHRWELFSFTEEVTLGSNP